MRGLRILAAAAAMFFLAGTARADDDSSIELNLTQLDVQAEGSMAAADGTGGAFGFAFEHLLSDKGMVSGRVNLVRFDGAGDGDVGGYQVDVGAALNFGDNTSDDGDPRSRFVGFMRGSLGGTWRDSLEQQVPVTIVTEGAGAMTTEEGAATGLASVETTDQWVGLGVEVGGKVYFDAARTVGVGFSGFVRHPLNAGVDVETTHGLSLLVILPAGRSAP